jgi:hypothetical protein
MHLVQTIDLVTVSGGGGVQWEGDECAGKTKLRSAGVNISSRLLWMWLLC